MRDLNIAIRDCLCLALDRDVSSLPGDSLLTEAGMDSLTFIQFIVLLEETLGIAINDSDLLQDNFTTIEATLERLRSYGL